MRGQARPERPQTGRTRSSTLIARTATDKPEAPSAIDPAAASLRSVSESAAGKALKSLSNATASGSRPRPAPVVVRATGPGPPTPVVVNTPSAPVVPTRAGLEIAEEPYPLERTTLTVYTYRPLGIATSNQPSPLPSTSSSAPASTVLVNYSSLPWTVRPGDYFEIRAIRRDTKAKREKEKTTSGDRATGGEALKGVSRHLGRGGFVFRVGEDAPNVPIGQIQVPDSVASAFRFQHRTDVDVIKLFEPDTAQIDHIELRFSQYLGRADMWRLGMLLESQTVHVGERINLVGGAARAEVHAIWRGGDKFSSGIVTSKTKTIYRSRSAQVYLFIQLCAETWQFDEDGERYYEKVVHGLLPDLFSRWNRKSASHLVTIILFGRIHYDDLEVAYMEANGITEGLTKDYAGRWCKDFFRVAFDFERRADWAQALPLLKKRIETSERELISDFHLGLLDAQPDKEDVQRKLLGKWSFAYEGNVLETVNIALNPFDEHYIDRDLSRTGLTMAVLTPGTGNFAVDKNLLRLTTERMVDHGFSLDLICLTKMPLHSVPLFSYVSKRPKALKSGNVTGVATPDLLYFDAHLSSATDTELSDCYSIPKWVNASFFSKTADKPFRPDRFIARSKMYEIQMLGILDHNMTTVTVPLLDVEDYTRTLRNAPEDERKKVRDEFDAAIFVLPDAQATGSSPPMIPESKPVSAPNSRAGSVAASKPGSVPASYQSARLMARLKEETSSSHTPVIPEASPSRTESPVTSHLSVSPSKAFNKVLIDVNNLEPLDLSRTEVRASSPAPSSLSLRRNRPHSESVSSLAASQLQDVLSADGGSGQSTPRVQRSLRKQPSKTSFASRFGSNWLFGAFSTRSQPSYPAAAAETVGRQDVSTTGSRPPSPVVTKVHVDPISVPGTVEVQPPTPSPHREFKTSQPLPIARAGGTNPKRNPPNEVELSRSLRNSSLGAKLSRSPRSPGVAASLSAVVSDSWGRSADLGRASRHVTVNPCNPREDHDGAMLEGRRWQHVSPHARSEEMQALMKWTSLVAPACLPLTTDYLPTPLEIQDFYQVNSYEIACFHDQVSFLIRPDAAVNNLALAVMREMASQRLGQNFQYIVLPHDSAPRPEEAKPHKKILGSGDFMTDDLRIGGASEALRDPEGIIYLLLSHHIHRLACDTAKQSVTVQTFVRRIKYETRPVMYKCLVWPCQMKGFQLATATFRYPDVESKMAFNYLDRLINGDEEALADKVRYWRTRYLLIPSGRDPPSLASIMPKGDTFDRSEILMEGAERVLDVFNKLALKRSSVYAPYAGNTSNKDWRTLKLIPTSFDPSACVLDDGLMMERERVVRNEEVFERGKNLAGTTLKEVGEMMCKEKNGLMIYDRWYHFRMHEDSFSGEQFCEWLLRTFEDVKTLEQAAEWARTLFEKGLIEHVTGAHAFHSTGHLFYRMRPAYDKNARKRRILPWLSSDSASTSTSTATKTPRDVIEKHAKLSTSPYSGTAAPIGALSTGGKVKKRKVRMSQSAVIDLDPGKKSDRAEVAVLHADIIHNARNALHFELNWLGVTAGLLDELRQKCAAQAEKYGLRFVEAPVEQIKDTSLKCAYRSAIPIPLALAPPVIPDLHARLQARAKDQTTGNVTHFFEQKILTEKFGFVLDVEAANRYPETVDVLYAYRRESRFDYSQFCHKSGLSLVQCVGGESGYLWADNRLFISGPTKGGRRGDSGDTYPNAPVPRMGKAEEVRQLREELERFCLDKEALGKFYEEITPPPVGEGDDEERKEEEEKEKEKQDTVEKTV